jgi:hypothetical protein
MCGFSQYTQTLGWPGPSLVVGQSILQCLVNLLFWSIHDRVPEVALDSSLPFPLAS